MPRLSFGCSSDTNLAASRGVDKHLQEIDVTLHASCQHACIGHGINIQKFMRDAAHSRYQLAHCQANTCLQYQTATETIPDMCRSAQQLQVQICQPNTA